VEDGISQVLYKEIKLSKTMEVLDIVHLLIQPQILVQLLGEVHKLKCQVDKIENNKIHRKNRTQLL